MIASPDQVRALLRMEQQELAERARISVATVRRLEAGESTVAPETVERVQTALEAAGAEFIERGVRHRPAPPARTDEEKEALYRDLMAIAERAASEVTNPGFSEDDLYDENGLPA